LPLFLPFPQGICFRLCAARYLNDPWPEPD
jgi:hypothetical protein